VGERKGWDHQTPIELGIPEIIPVTTPAAGADWTQTVPANTLWLIQAISYDFQTVGGFGGRRTRLRLTDGTSTMNIGFQTPDQPAGVTRNHLYTASPGPSPVTEFLVGTLIPRLYLLPSWIITSATINIQAGDIFSEINLYVHRWLLTT